MSEIDIRPFREADEQAVVALWSAVFGYDDPHNEPRAVIRSKTAAADGLFFVASRGGRVVGTIMGGYDGHRGWIYLVAVAEDVQRRGVGRALVQRLEEELAERGCAKINLQIHAYNDAVVGFYEKLGYAVEPRVSMGKRFVKE